MRDRPSKKPDRGLCALLLAAMIIAGCPESPKATNAPSPRTSAKPVSKQTQTVASAPTQTVAVEKPVYSYVPGGRRDPFAPIIVKQTKKGKTGDRPPLERYDVNEFKLSGIIWGGFGYNAILEGPDGKGYFVRVGTLLGPNGGVIKKITQNALIVEEKFKDFSGQSERKEIVKQLSSRQEERP